MDVEPMDVEPMDVEPMDETPAPPSLQEDEAWGLALPYVQTLPPSLPVA